jgi:hypothetical protein
MVEYRVDVYVELGWVIETDNVRITFTEPKSEVVGFEDNPWVQILRVRYGSQNP